MKSAKSEKRVDELLELIYNLVKELHPHFSKSSVTLEDDFEKDLGLDSLSRVELISRIEASFNTSFPDKVLHEAQTPKDILEMLLGSKAHPAISSYLEKSALELKETASLPTDAQTLVEVLFWHVKEHPDRPHIQLYEDDGKGEVITYFQLKKRALKVAFGLQKLGLKPAQAVAIMLPTSADYFYSFFGILMAGGIPVPIYPPARPSQLEEHMQRHTKILNNCEAGILVTVPQAKQVAKILKSYAQDLEEIVTVTELSASKNFATLPLLHADDTAFIQYTSGSTGDPKGVVLTHANLLTNIRSMGQVVNATSKDVFISWLPLYHDMGLIGAWFGSLYHASFFIVMSPLSFLAKPQRWLWAIHQYGGTLSASPNFGYEYCLHRLKDVDLTGLDLSTWRAAFNGAEAVSPLTIKNFSEHFKAYNFNPKAMTPVYGLAESSVGLTFPPMLRGPLIDSIERDTFMKNKKADPIKSKDELALHFVSSGLPLPRHQIRVVGPTGHELPERHEGELQFCGPSSTSGYYQNTKKNEELFEKSWLNTGDRAYISNGELFLTGRVKDIIIRAGRNIYPDEVEKAIGNIEGIRKGCVAVFGTLDKKTATERLIVLAETKVQDRQIRESLQKQINILATDLIGGPPDEIVLAQQGAVLKTSSGKIRRAASRDLYEKKGGKAGSQNLLWQFTRLILKSILPRIQRLLRLLKSRFFALYSWGVFVIFTLITWLSIVLLPTLHGRWSMMRFCAHSVARLTFTKIDIKGLENLPNDLSNTVIVVNHSSYIDSLVLVAFLPRPVSFVAKAELLRLWTSRIPLKKIKTQFVERFDISKSVDDSRRLKTALKEETLLFFPEGTFTRVPGLKPFHLGAFSVAAEADASVVPIAITGTRSLLRPGAWFPQHGEIGVHIGEVIRLSDKEKNMDIWHKALVLSQKSRDFILKYCKEPDLIYEETP
jgi:acyl carrier protein